ncbi:GNAT family N-acetyltransferase [Streptomyces sp. NPDC056500]|uniref:GNAT family N-acetyltransferase n=1 Tax=Streptomyces sp. NPDC056500 TaxID=3345840 RepID=UPI0036B41E4C
MVQQWVRLELDVRAFDRERFNGQVERCRKEGLVLTTLAELGDAPEHRRTLYELNRECSADIPGRGEFYSYEEYVKQRLEVASFDPRGVVIALDGDTWIGMAATSHHGRFVFNEMTGVIAPHRRRGLSIAMKTFGLDFARLHGVHTVRTVHHPANTRAIAMNRALGFVDAHWETP